MTGWGWVGAEGSGPEFGVEDTGLEGGDAESSGSGVGEGDDKIFPEFQSRWDDGCVVWYLHYELSYNLK